MLNLNLKPAVDNYCVVGNPVAHSKSPQIQAAFAEQTSQAMFYQAIYVELDGFASMLGQFRDLGGRGMNITLPFKEEAWQLADDLTDRATLARAVNTIAINEDGRILGDNTDGAGLVNDLMKNHGVTINNTSVLILGAGGATRGILGPILAQVPQRIVIANRTVSKAEDLADAFSQEGDVTALGYPELEGRKFDLVINATAASLQGEVPPLPDDMLTGNACCYDLFYSDGDTAFVTWARQQGAAVCLDGMGMLIEQAAESFYLWRGVRPDTAPIIEKFTGGNK